MQVGKYENCHVAFEAVDVSVGTLPKGSSWRKGPIPSAPWSREATGSSFPPPCQESEACTKVGSHADNGPHSSDEGAFPCECSVCCHDIAGIWVAFFSRWRRYRC